ncbi:fork-head transcriptional regulator 2 [Podospora australis]|uniref:Fork-head transcriptional regulator 2 n=1 Tax=Podospora australis TaxID=1536484 RepID=A0AAN7AL86_9PEZI|nr:fork-head transcriptional regulator 2 [Podospora australis]
MPSPSKRTATRAPRAQRNEAVAAASTVADSSSPSRPSKRRKKNDESAADTTEPIDEGDSSLVAEHDDGPIEDDDVVSKVIQSLRQPPGGDVAAAVQWSNALHLHTDSVSAYAKIAAFDWTYYITRLRVNIGRQSEGFKTTEEYGDDHIHIDLGPSKLISRLHAIISFNAEKEEWWLEVKGRNALKVDGHLWKAGEAGALRSGCVIEAGGCEMIFVLPIGGAQIDRTFLERAGIVKAQESVPATKSRRPLPSGDGLQSSSPNKSSRGNGQKTLAPAPPDYKRPGTPPSARQSLAAKTPIADVPAGPILMSNTDVDLTLDENQHIKPQFSYAQMITQAIITEPDQKRTLNGIYQYIQEKYSYYRHQAAGGWQNSIRHNLSLNKAFEKVARSTDEPGKGMKWQITAEWRDEFIKNAWRGGRGGHRGNSSNPSSPSQPLNYITSGPRDMAARDPISARKRKAVSPSGSPQPRSALGRDSHSTPVRTRKPLPDEPGAGIDGSPLPRLRKPNTSSTLGMVETAPGSPTLGSSYLPEEGAPLATPAPHRAHLKLAPPSTAQRPSQHMPTSSPAPFWKYAELQATPLKSTSLDFSPIKPTSALPPASSSPPPPPRSKSPVASPTRPSSRLMADEPTSPAPIEEEQGFDLTKGFQSISSYHAPVTLGHQVQPPISSHGDPSHGDPVAANGSS